MRSSLSSLARRAAFAAVAGAAAVTVVASAAGAATTPAKAYSKDISGYSTTRWVRYNVVTFNLPSNTQCAQTFAPRSPQGDGIAITLGAAEESNAGSPLSAGPASALGVSFVPSATGCGPVSPSFASNLAGGAPQFPAGGVNLQPSDSVTLSLYYNQGAKFTQAVVVDNTNGTSAHENFDGAATYVGGSITGGFGAYTPAGGKQAKLWAVKTSAMTTYTGVHAAIGSFNPSQIVMTSDGTRAGTAYATAGALWGDGANFSVFGH